MDLDKQANTSISIHALREEGDLISCIRLEMTRIFLSTPSARRATFRNEVLEMSCEISIHALREEGDSQIRKISPSRRPFLSTPSARRATLRRSVYSGLYPEISIHALREEGDCPCRRKD